MNERKCETCANRNTPWCKGCEYNFPGLEQFDFYSKVRVDKENDKNG